MKPYINLLTKILAQGELRSDRTGTGTRALFGESLDIDLTQGFPLLTTKKIFYQGVVAELLWFISGSTNVKDLQKDGVNIWNAWADEDGDLGPVYGQQWRMVNKQGSVYIDQFMDLLTQLRENPYSRRHIVDSWNVALIDQMALPPCHCLYQLYVDNDDRLSLQLYQRSADMFLGVPFNIASYALLVHLIARHVGLKVGRLKIVFGDCHIYINHEQQVNNQIIRKPRPLPKLSLSAERNNIFEVRIEDIEFIGYNPHPAIKGDVSV